MRQARQNLLDHLPVLCPYMYSKIGMVTVNHDLRTLSRFLAELRTLLGDEFVEGRAYGTHLVPCKNNTNPHSKMETLRTTLTLRCCTTWSTQTSTHHHQAGHNTLRIVIVNCTLGTIRRGAVRKKIFSGRTWSWFFFGCMCDCHVHCSSKVLGYHSMDC